MVTNSYGLNQLSIKYYECAPCSDFLIILEQSAFPCRMYELNYQTTICGGSITFEYTLTTDMQPGTYIMYIYCIDAYIQDEVAQETIYLEAEECQ